MSRALLGRGEVALPGRSVGSPGRVSKTGLALCTLGATSSSGLVRCALACFPSLSWGLRKAWAHCPTSASLWELTRQPIIPSEPVVLGTAPSPEAGGSWRSGLVPWPGGCARDHGPTPGPSERSPGGSWAQLQDSWIQSTGSELVGLLLSVARKS